MEGLEGGAGRVRRRQVEMLTLLPPPGGLPAALLYLPP